MIYSPVIMEYGNGNGPLNKSSQNRHKTSAFTTKTNESLPVCVCLNPVY